MVDTTNELCVESDASDFATGAVLSMKCDDGKWHPYAYLSKGLNDVEQNYDVQDKEMLGIMHALCYRTALIFHFFSLFGLVDIIIRFKGGHMVNTCCSTTHGFLMFDCALLRTSWLPHVEYSRTTYIRILQDASCITHVFHLVYIVYQIAY